MGVKILHAEKNLPYDDEAPEYNELLTESGTTIML